jgi:hypothetical protein
MRIHQDLTFTGIDVRLYAEARPPFVTLSLIGSGDAGAIFLDSKADCATLRQAVDRAEALLERGTGAP